MSSTHSTRPTRSTRSTLPTGLLGAVMLLVLLSSSAGTQQSAPQKFSSDWPMYRHDFAGTGYSPLTQIDARNVTKLVRAWSYSLEGTPPSPPPAGGRG